MRRLSGFIYPLAAVVGVVVLWYAVVIIFKLPKFILPLPGDVWQRIVEDFNFLVWHSLITSYETLGGFALSIILGIPIAIALVASRTLDRALMPWLIPCATVRSPPIARYPARPSACACRCSASLASSSRSHGAIWAAR